ncbi:gonadal protein gdl isoform X2 [Anopheles cruzii]|uniref:gonadal protein gdl isoform X2 n=1 Tax=Anopheles cruzii TaxID=68878 RepID=UPI0022EC433E|nr:gonadal protein gdl isoform X2 [Anopheles cruzii]
MASDSEEREIISQDSLTEDSSAAQTIDPYHNQEYLQRKLYFLLENLKKMHTNLPEQYQMRISFELLAGLANTLLNDTIFEIAKGLMEIQHVTEAHLMQVREKWK